MSIQNAALLVAIIVGITTVIKLVMDIATTPTHRSMALRIFGILYIFLPSVLVVIAAMVMPGIWSLVLLTLTLIWWLLDYARKDAPMSRLENAFLVLCVSLLLILIQLSLLLTALDRIAAAIKPQSVVDTEKPRAASK